MMQEQGYLEQLPQAALELREGRVAQLNTAASRQLPQLLPGTPVPEELARAIQGGAQAGSFTQGEASFLFTRVAAQNGELILFRPAQDCGVTGEQLDGFSRRMRGQMGEMLNQLQQLSNQAAEGTEGRLDQVSQSFYEMLCLVNHLEFLNIPEQEAQMLFSPVTMDLAGMARQTVRQAALLLRPSGVEVRWADGASAGLLIPGDPKLLQQLLLALISNAAHAAPGGAVTVGVRPWQDKAVLTVSDQGNGEPVDLNTLLRGRQPERRPAPGEGAGMGLGVIRRIAALHGGTLLLQPGRERGLTAVVALPMGPLPTRLPLSTPKLETDGGISPFLVELADLLSPEVFRDE